MKISKRITSNNTTRADIVGNTLTNITNDMGGAYSKFLDGMQPTKTKWYNIDHINSLDGKGFKDSAGPYDGGIKYKVIRDYIVYGYQDERPVDVEQGENLRVRYKVGQLTFMHIPGALEPRVGDRLSLEIEEHRYLYKVIESVPTTFKNKPFIKTVVSRDEINGVGFYEEDFRAKGLLSEEFEYVEDNIGTNYNPFLKSDTLATIAELEAYKEEINEQFHDYFYNEAQNVFASIDADKPGYLTYTPLLVDLQMDFRTLWTFGVNTILTHETLVNRRNKYNYKNNVIRQFLHRVEGAWGNLKVEGVKFSGYIYNRNITSPNNKIQSYFNDGGRYYIYDYYYGDIVFGNGNDRVYVSVEDTLTVPESLHELFQKYTDDTLTPEFMIEFLKGWDFEICFCCMIMAFMVLTILKELIEKQKKINSDKGLLR